jgi:hypothetical protein
MACNYLNPVCYYIHTRSSQPNLECLTRDFAYPLTILYIVLILIPISFFLIHNTSIIAEHNFKTFLSFCACHEYVLTQSTAYAEYGIHSRLVVFPSFP